MASTVTASGARRESRSFAGHPHGVRADRRRGGDPTTPIGFELGGTNDAPAPCERERAHHKVQRRADARASRDRPSVGDRPAATFVLGVTDPVGDPLLRDLVGREHRPHLLFPPKLVLGSTQVGAVQHLHSVTSGTCHPVGWGNSVVHNVISAGRAGSPPVTERAFGSVRRCACVPSRRRSERRPSPRARGSRAARRPCTPGRSRRTPTASLIRGRPSAPPPRAGSRVRRPAGDRGHLRMVSRSTDPRGGPP